MTSIVSYHADKSMPAAKDFSLYAPVQFAAGGRLVRGHVAHKSLSCAIAVSEDGREYKVPWPCLQPDSAGVEKRVSPREEECAGGFSPGTAVSFPFRSDTLRGVVVSNGPKYARVTSDGQDYTVPYGLLAALDSRSTNSDRQRLADCVEMAESLIKKHGLESWSFQFDNARNRAGCCNYTIRVISLSRLYCLKAGQDQVRDTILHEIAHALAGHGHNHDAKWKSIARSIGCTADRCHSVDFAPAKYIVSCLRCGWHEKKNRRLRGAICRTCQKPVTYRHFSEQDWERCSEERRRGLAPSAAQ